MADLFCGVDFGMSNSTVALADGTRSWLLALEGDEVTLPSAVFWDADGAPPEFGRAAIAAYIGGNDGRLMRGLKSTLGSGLINERAAVGSRAVSFKDVLGRFFGHMKAQLDTATGGMSQVVLGRPVHFVDDAPAADARAQAVLEAIARAAGFREMAFQYEPIAAAMQCEQVFPARPAAVRPCPARAGGTRPRLRRRKSGHSEQTAAMGFSRDFLPVATRPANRDQTGPTFADPALPLFQFSGISCCCRFCCRLWMAFWLCPKSWNSKIWADLWHLRLCGAILLPHHEVRAFWGW